MIISFFIKATSWVFFPPNFVIFEKKSPKKEKQLNLHYKNKKKSQFFWSNKDNVSQKNENFKNFKN
jgi:hypothetical protein